MAIDDRGPVDDRRYAEVADVVHFTARGLGPIVAGVKAAIADALKACPSLAVTPVEVQRG